MIRALLLGAFATSAFAGCGKDVSAVACRDFSDTTDFNVQNNGVNIDGESLVKMTGKMVVNAAHSYIGSAPWHKNVATTGSVNTDFAGQPNGCVFTDASIAGTSTAAVQSGPSPAVGSWTCATEQNPTACTGDANKEQALRTYEVGTTLTAMVTSLDDAGRFAVYFQRVLENPIGGSTLKWIAENACKVYVDVEFECTGGNCVEVTTIVCASFAGIKADNRGNVAIECKVPNGFGISSENPNLNGVIAPGANLDDFNGAVSGGLVLESVWDGTDPTITGTMVFNSGTGQASTGTLTGEVTTVATLGESQGVSGLIEVRAFVCQGSCGSYTAGEWTTSVQVLHKAKYNLTRASNQAKTFDMNVNVLFYSDELSAVETDRAAIAAYPAFGQADTQRPFLARTNVEYGTISQHINAYLSVVAKVATDATVSFGNLRVKEVTHTIAGTAQSPEAETSSTSHCDQVGGTGYFSAANWPQAFLSCSGMMDASTSIRGAAVTAGDTLTLKLAWKLFGATPSTGTGKAALLQDAADEVQSVEVSLTIQLGGGETTITTAGGSDGSADPTVTYIIIAVCIVAAGLILAVVVVAFMCMRNRSQEAIVSMSPQKCTVAAVYDISQPKKADAMDV